MSADRVASADSASPTGTGCAKRWIGGLIAASALVGLSACGDDSVDEESIPSTSAAPTTTTTQPPATDTEAALAAVQDLADERSALLEELYKDPTVVDDPDNENLVALADLYTDDSDTVETVAANLREFADRGDRWLAGPSGVFSDYHLFDAEPDGDDTLRFRYCFLQDREGHDIEEGRLGGGAYLTPGEGEASRVDGRWHLISFDQLTDPMPRDPETIGPGTCESETEQVQDMLDTNDEAEDQ